MSTHTNKNTNGEAKKKKPVHFEVVVDRFHTPHHHHEAPQHTKPSAHAAGAPTPTPHIIPKPHGTPLPHNHNQHGHTAIHAHHTAKPAEAPSKGMCIFDIDNTLTRGPLASVSACGPLPMTPPCTNCMSEDRATMYNVGTDRNIYPAPYAKQAVAACKAEGLRTVVATGEHCKSHFPGDKYHVDTRLQFLKDLGFGKDVVRVGANGQLERGPNLLCSDPSNAGNKAIMVKKLLKSTHTPADRAVFWDDNTIYRQQVRTVGDVTIAHASRQCGGAWCPEGCGITQGEFKKGMAEFHKKHPK
eukprot:PhF_6_TR19964/c0_g1_i3/m.29105